MASEVLLTVITVVYNGEADIADSIKSIVHFKKKHSLQYIIVDGGSTDGTLTIIDTYKREVDLLISESDKGIYDAMNKGAKAAVGKYTIYINSGDRLEDFNLKDVLFSDELDVVYGNVLLQGNSVKKPERLDIISYAMPFSHQAVFVRTNLLKTYKFQNSLKIAGDFDFFQRLYLSKKKFSYNDVNVSYFKGDGVSAVMTKQYIKEYVFIIRKNKVGIFWQFALLKFYMILILAKYKNR